MAGSSVIGALRVNLGLDSAQFSKGAKNAQSSMGGLKKSIVSNGAAIAAAAATAAAGIVAFAIKSAAGIDQTAKAARRLGESVAGFRGMELAAEEAGVGVSTLTDGVQTMNRELAKGGKEANSALAQLGIDAAAFKEQKPAEQLATLADAIQSTGASSGDASALLQKLGVRNKEMVLALVSGGSAFRDAAKDIADYGLAMSDVDAASIEKANDQMGRLGLVGKYLGDQLALAIVPALGALSQSFTDSLREGGLLRMVLDAVAGAVRGVVEIVSASVNIIGGLIGVIADLAIWVWDITGGFFGLGTAISNIWDALSSVISWAYDLITGFSDLIDATGSFASAMGMLADVAVEVWERIKLGADSLVSGLDAGWQGMKSTFFYALHDMMAAFSSFVGNVAQSLNDVFGTSLNTSPMMGALTSLNKAGNDAAGLAQKSAGAAATAWAAVSAPLESVRAMKNLIIESKKGIEDTQQPVTNLSGLLDEMGGKGGGAAGGVKKIKDAVDEVAKAADRGADAIGGLFTGLLNGSKSVKESVGQLILKIAEMQLMKGFSGLFGSGGAFSGIGSFIGNLIGANAAGTNHWSGGLTSINERGGEIVDLPSGSRIIPHDVSNRIASGGSGGVTNQITINVSGARGNAEITEMVEAGIRQAAPGIAGSAVQQVRKNMSQSKGFGAPA